eukprot:UN29115
MPWTEVMSVSAAIFTFAVSSMIVEPIFPFMTQWFYPNLEPEEVGRYSGFLYAAFFFGNLIGAVFFGFMADRYGRRPCLITGCVGVLPCVLMFGFARSFPVAVASRVLWGLFQGNIPVCRASLGELTPRSKQAQAFSMIGLSFGVGKIFGPSIGGLLSFPAKKYTPFMTPFWLNNPFVLPTIVACAICCVTTFLVYWNIPETLDFEKLKAKQNKSADEIPTENYCKSLKVWSAVIVFGFTAFSYMGQMSLYPLWSFADYDHYGIGFTEQEIGVTISLCALVQLVSIIICDDLDFWTG